MFEFIHDIFESFILKSASGGLGPFGRALMQSHLRSCMRCRAFALDLVEFSHSLEPGKKEPRLSAPERDEIHARVMAAFHRELREERLALPFERAAGPLIRPSFVKAMASLAVVLGAAFVLSTPFRRGGIDGAGPQGASASMPSGAHDALSALDSGPTPTPTPSPAKIENK
jgi:hypothetical protein